MRGSSEHMKIYTGIFNAGWSRWQSFGQVARQGLALVLSLLMITIPLEAGNVFAQSVPRPPGEGQPSSPAPDSQPLAAQGQPLSAEGLDQLVAPIALYPDALLAQILAASTYPTQLVEADRWRQAQGNAPPEQIAAGAESQDWDPSVKALTAFPTVLAQMDRNIRWTTDLGNAYYNQPQDVMEAVQAMRQKAQAAGQLRSTPQQVVTDSGGAIAIAPANPAVVYVPVYDPWVVYGAPFPVYPGYYYAPPPGVFWAGLAIGFGVGIAVGFFTHWAWGWGHWGLGWGSHAVFYNHAPYFTHSTTVINRGLSRPGGPLRSFGVRGAYARAGFNRPRPMAARNMGYRGAGSAYRPGESFGRPGREVPRPSGTVSRSGAYSYRQAGSYARAGTRPEGFSQRAAIGHGGSSFGSGHSSRGYSGGGHWGGGHASGGHSGGGHSGGGHHGHGH
jgi:hypothetical protein